VKTFIVLSLISLVIIISACSLTSPELSTPTPSGIPVRFGNISFRIPEGLATSASFKTSIDVEFPYINPSFGDMPEHTVITLDGYTVSGRSGRILIFNASEFAAYTDLTRQTITALQTLPSGQTYPEDLYNHPYTNLLKINAEGTFGQRYVTQVMDSFIPYNNEDIFYYYEGLSNDGTYYFEALLPVNASFLPVDGNPSTITPADGVQFPFNVEDMLTFQAQFHEYSTLIAEKLNNATPASFTPSLAVLDALINSVTTSP
jgi:hypothetical protein